MRNFKGKLFVILLVVAFVGMSYSERVEAVVSNRDDLVDSSLKDDNGSSVKPIKPNKGSNTNSTNNTTNSNNGGTSNNNGNSGSGSTTNNNSNSGSGATNVDTSDVVQTELAQYALSWNNNVNIPYVYGGGRTGTTLEVIEKTAKISGHPNGSGCPLEYNIRCEKCKPTGTDCSGFVALVYKHFGIDVPAQSDDLKAAAVSTFTDISKAVPGDVCWWNEHVAIYIGEGKIIHTNKTDPPLNYPHVSTIDGDSADYSFPTLFLRMVEDVSVLGVLSEDEAKEFAEEVKNTLSMGTLVTESDLTGLDITDVISKGYQRIPDITPLSDRDTVVMNIIKDDLLSKDMGFFGYMGVAVSFLGLCCILYGVFLGIAYLFDRVNNIFDISLLGILTLGKYRIWEEYLGVSKGVNKRDGIVYCDAKFLIARIILIEAVGLFLVSGGVFQVIIKVIRFVSSIL